MERIVLIQSPPEKQGLSVEELLRKRIKVDEQGIENLTFKIAETQNELESAFRLIHDAYVKSGYMNTSSSALRFGFFNAMPYTQTFLSKSNGDTIMTITLFPDSPLGLPLDKLYKREIDTIREKGRYIAEVGGLASVVNNQNAILHLIKLLYYHAEELLKIDDLVITVHPKHKNFYKVILCFEEIGEIKSYPDVKDNPAIALRLDLHRFREYYWNFYPREPLEKDLHHFFFIKNSESILLPESKSPLRIWNAKLFNYFFLEKTNMYFEADDKTRELMEKYYGEYICA